MKVMLFTHEIYCADPTYGEDRRNTIHQIELAKGWLVRAAIKVETTHRFNMNTPLDLGNVQGHYEILYSTRTVLFERFGEALMVYLRHC
jgi:hypothetical protein